jgi:hypothetical protein
MKKVIAGCLSLWVVVIVLFFLTGCTYHITKDVSDKLNHDELYKSHNVHPKDLSLNSKCEKAPTIKIVNVESRIEDYFVLKNSQQTGIINPKEMMDGVVLYLKKGFELSHIKVDDQSTKVLYLKMTDMKTIMGVFSVGSYFKVGLIIPETGVT